MNKYVKYGLIALASVGVIYGAYKLYDYYNKEEGFKTKFGRKIKSVNTNVSELN